MVAESARSSIGITFSVWKALFLREAVQRLFSSRAAWLWLLLEPVVHIVFLMFIFTVVRLRSIGGVDTAVWVMVGMLGFFAFRRTATQAMNAVASNHALFVYRQVKPVDTVLSRAALEGFLMLLVAAILLAGAALFGFAVVPHDPLLVLQAFTGLWLFGVGFGLITSAAQELVPEMGKVTSLLMIPLYFFSGVIFPIASVPQPYRGWLMLNPVAHGLEMIRLGFASHYQAAAEADITYVFAAAIIAVFLGLVLHVRFATRMVAR